ncbi:hypothetical protein GC197_18425 [bacterium]|nr:hypothetical protein [bacterium]
MDTLPSQHLAEIDLEIFKGYLPGVIKIRAVLGVTLNVAKDLFWKRYEELRKESNSQFTKNHEDYCSGILE